MSTRFPIDATGVKVMPGDSNGYIYDGVYVTYRMCRLMMDYYARKHPDEVPALAMQAGHLNALHMRRVLSQSVYRVNEVAWHKMGEWSVANMPRESRGKFSSQTK